MYEIYTIMELQQAPGKSKCPTYRGKTVVSTLVRFFYTCVLRLQVDTKVSMLTIGVQGFYSLVCF